MKIQSILKSCELQIEHERTQNMRAAELLTRLKIARENNKSPNMSDKNFTAAQMMTEMDKNEIRYELNYAIILLTDYQTTQSFGVAKPSEAYTTEFADKLNSIKDSVEAIVNKYLPDSPK